MRSRYRWRYDGRGLRDRAGLWIGVGWTRRVDFSQVMRTGPIVLLDVHICIVPMLPISLRFRREKR